MKRTLMAVGVVMFLGGFSREAAAQCFVCKWIGGEPGVICYDVGYSESGRKACRIWYGGGGYWYCETTGGPCDIPEGKRVSDPKTNVAYDLVYADCAGGFSRVFAAGSVPGGAREFRFRFDAVPTAPVASMGREPTHAREGVKQTHTGSEHAVGTTR